MSESNKQLFVVAIGGTGMRCLESFVHLCAIGMFDGEEINILTLDTDQTNGNKGRVEQLIELYNKIKSTDPAKIDGGTPNVDTFFSAKLNLYKFFTDYTNQQRKTYKLLSQMSNLTPEQDADNEDLARLFLDENTVQQFELDHGYRAQTHLGSMLMYHGIVEAAINYAQDKDKAHEQEKALCEFLTKLAEAGQTARVFVFGSVFGGTGASSIPVIPPAFKEATAICTSNALDLNKVKFGSTLLTQYFTFPAPDANQLREQKVVANSQNFALNSQAALQFYQGDPTVKAVYKRLYLIGWPLPADDKMVSKSDKPITGGGDQKNACHVVELMSACAAFDFFSQNDENLSNEVTQYVYRSVHCDANALDFEGSDFVGNYGKKFMNKLGAMFSFAHVVLAKQGAAFGMDGVKSLLGRLNDQNITDFDSLEDSQAKEIDNYLKLFGYEYNEKADIIVPGWIYQIRASVGQGKFIFDPKAFPQTLPEIKKVDPGNIFSDEKYQWKKTWPHDRYDYFIGTTVKNSQPRDDQKVNTVKERFLATIYNGITNSQNIKDD